MIKSYNQRFTQFIIFDLMNNRSNIYPKIIKDLEIVNNMYVNFIIQDIYFNNKFFKTYIKVYSYIFKRSTTYIDDIYIKLKLFNIYVYHPLSRFHPIKRKLYKSADKLNIMEDEIEIILTNLFQKEYPLIYEQFKLLTI